MNEELFSLQAEIIKDLANQGPCIIIGRGADYILRENERMLSVFIHADMETKLEIVCRHYNLSREEAAALIRKTDKQRSVYYNYYTEYKWGDIDNYDITLDRWRLGIEKCVEQNLRNSYFVHKLFTMRSFYSILLFVAKIQS